MKIPNLKKNRRMLELLKWVFIVFLFSLIFIGNLYFYERNFLVKFFITIVLLFAIGLVCMTTFIGKSIISLILESYHEIKKVVWPSYQEVLNNTIMIVVITIITSMTIWGLDNLLIRIISFSSSIRLF